MVRQRKYRTPPQGYFILLFLKRTGQGSHILVALLYTLLFQLPKLKNYKNEAALTRALKKEWDEVTPDNVCDICTTAPCRIKALVQNGGSYIEYFF